MTTVCKKCIHVERLWLGVLPLPSSYWRCRTHINTDLYPLTGREKVRMLYCKTVNNGYCPKYEEKPQ